MKLSRNTTQRKALMRTQLNSLVNSGHITTTIAKAKLIKPLFDRLVTKAKTNTIATRRLLAADLASTASANRLVDTIAPLFQDKNCGYTFSAKIGTRRGDGVTLVNLKLTADLPKPVEEVKAVKSTKISKTPAKQDLALQDKK